MKLTGAAWCVVVAAALGGVPPAIAASPSPSPSSPAPPPTESQVADAKQHYAAGSKLFDLAEYEGALHEFKEAYRAVEDPAFLFNIAQCHRKLGHAQDAITFYKTYLRRAPRAANRPEVEHRIAELEREPSKPAPAPAEETTAPVVAPVIAVPPPAPDKGPAADALVGPAPSPPPAAAESPFYKRGWFWIVTGAVVGGTVTTVLVMHSRTEPTRFCPDCAGTVVLPP
jgi:tetratricopeptide (TPR) repeat protein